MIRRRAGWFGVLVFLCVHVSMAQTTRMAGDTLYPGWADSSGGIGINPTNPGTMCCWNANKAMKFSSINFGTTPYKFMIVNYASGEPGCYLVPSFDPPSQYGGGGTPILDNPATFNAMPIMGSGGWGMNCRARIRMKPVTGTHPLYLYSGRCQNTGGTIDINWFIFTNDSTSYVYWDWTQPVEMTIKPGSGGATSVAVPAKAPTSGVEVFSVTRSGLGLNLREEGSFSVRVLSLSGELIAQRNLNGPGAVTIAAGEMTPGVYLIKVGTRGKTITQTFVVR